MNVRLIAAIGALFLGQTALAQEGNWMMPAPAPSAAAQKAVAVAQGPTLKAGTEVPLKLADSAKGRKLGVGQRVPLAVASNVTLGSAVVIPAGAVAEGEVTALQGKTLAARALNVRVGTKLVRLTGTFDGARAKAFLGEDIRVTQ